MNLLLMMSVDQPMRRSFLQHRATWLTNDHRLFRNDLAGSSSVPSTADEPKQRARRPQGATPLLQTMWCAGRQSNRPLGRITHMRARAVPICNVARRAQEQIFN